MPPSAAYDPKALSSAVGPTHDETMERMLDSRNARADDSDADGRTYDANWDSSNDNSGDGDGNEAMSALKGFEVSDWSAISLKPVDDSADGSSAASKSS